MLPPVTATSSTDVPFGNLPAQQNAPPQTTSAVKDSNASEATSAAALLVKASLASLSSELQFTQNVTVLADAIGKLLNIAKQDSESASAYIQRLTTAINALPMQQRAALELKITQLLPGLSLSMLVETLKNQTGPQAARLALLVETAPFRGSDLATRAVVSSYRQNVGGEQNNVTQQAPSIPLNATKSGMIVEPALRQSISTAAALISKPPIRTATANTPSLAITTTERQRGDQVTAAPIKAATDSRGPILNVEQGRVIPNKSDTLAPMSLNRPAQIQDQATITMQSQQIALKPNQDAKAVPDIRLAVPNSKEIANPEVRPQEQKPLEKTAFLNAPVNGNTPKESAQPAPTPASPIAALIGAITTASLPAQPSSSNSLFATLFGMVATSYRAPLDAAGSKVTSSAESTDDIADQLAKLPASEVQSRLLEAIRHLAIDHPQIQALLLTILRNEQAIAQSYAPYPPADDDYPEDEHHRGSWGHSFYGDDGEPNDQPEQDDRDDDDAGDGMETPHSTEQPVEIDAATELQAENYYLKMGTFN